jgi:hypothetical protein
MIDPLMAFCLTGLALTISLLVVFGGYAESKGGKG